MDFRGHVYFDREKIVYVDVSMCSHIVSNCSRISIAVVANKEVGVEVNISLKFLIKSSKVYPQKNSIVSCKNT